MLNKIVDFDPKAGMAFQGDLAIIAIPQNVTIDLTDEVQPQKNRLILMEGERTGHHHAIDLLDRPQQAETEKVNVQIEKMLSDASAGRIPLPSARTYRDPKVAEQMQKAGILTRVDLALCVLLIETGPMVVRHEEHAGIRLPVGRYLIGGQIESAGAETRRVTD